MGADIPKQFLEIDGVPIIIRTILKFLEVKDITRVYAAVHPDWVGYTQELADKFRIDGSRLKVIPGGSERNQTVMLITDSILEDFDVGGGDIIITHDAVRPFVTEKIIRDNISCAAEYGACGTVVGAVDTILRSEDGLTITDSPPRSQMFHAQTPQTFKIKLLRDTFSRLTDEQKNALTDTCSIFTVSGEDVHMVEGCRENIKITTPLDMLLAQAIAKMTDI